jgi:hypothetical protein
MAAISRELKEKDMEIKQLSHRIDELENTVKTMMDKLKSDPNILLYPNNKWRFKLRRAGYLMFHMTTILTSNLSLDYKIVN